jgi:hypothetical protein
VTLLADATSLRDYVPVDGCDISEEITSCIGMDCGDTAVRIQQEIPSGREGKFSLSAAIMSLKSERSSFRRFVREKDLWYDNIARERLSVGW